MFYISVAHGLRVEFARALRDIIFIPDPVDKARMITWGCCQNPRQEWDTLLRSSAQWLWPHGERIIPPPEELYPLVAAIFQTFGYLKDSKPGLPLFNSTAWALAKNVNVDEFGLDLLCCVRGSNYPEGGVHHHLLSYIPTSDAGICYANISLKDFICRQNLVANTTRSFKNFLFLEDVLINPRFITGLVNSNCYQPTKEVAGVLPVPEDIRVKYGMARFEPSLNATCHTTISPPYKAEGHSPSA
ncbi:hypothetical protein B0H13DRAFT_1902974 [Mycena leptocephala]|nr:hypothetical protein B0H13DRAFT_1902974 [Mycena leptocephala]